MWMQTTNKADTERVWVNFTNSDGQTVTLGYPVHKILGNANASSVNTNEAASRVAIHCKSVANMSGSLIGVAYEDVANGDVGIAQVYGYTESIKTTKRGSGHSTRSAEIIPGEPLGVSTAAAAASIGFDSAGGANLMGVFGPVVALDTIVVATSEAGGIGNHAFLRCM
jgi:hypothetical protein